MLMNVSLITVVVIITVTVTMVVTGVHVDQVIPYKMMDLSVLVSNVLHYVIMLVNICSL